MSGNCFCVRHKNANFRAKFPSWPIKLNTSMQEIKFTSHKQYLFGLLFSV